MARSPERVRENRLRRVAERQGLRLRKSPRRDPKALDYGLYAVIDTTGAIVEGGYVGLTLDQVESWLTS